MSSRKNSNEPPQIPLPNVIEKDIITTLETNYMPYAMSVIISRAIPEIDGLKPAHRKLLFTMYQMGLLTGDRVKSTKVVGQTMVLNPHGDSAIYETLVRLTKGNGALLHPFIDSKGNFGKQYSRDMAYAASRYTEVKLDKICDELLNGIDQNSVDMIDNYDGTTKEPLLFPVTFPNLLVTPNQGIAVGMASSICSFNLKEVCKATISFIKDNNTIISPHSLAPDFSTGGQLIYDQTALENIFKKGRGSFKVRAKYTYDKKNNCVEITEIPYTTTVEVIIDKIITLIKANKIREINDVRDETDLNGLRITLELKKNCNPDILMHCLFSLTPLCDSFNCNFNFLVNGRPRVMGIYEILSEWLNFRINCLRRQIAFNIKKKSEKAHLLEGLSKILLDIDKAIKIIRQTEEENLVIPNLMEGFEIDKLQAEFVAEIKLRNLNKEHILKRINELDDLRKDIENLQETHGSDEKIKNLICKQLQEIEKKYGKPRCTEIILEEQIPDFSEEILIEDFEVKLFLTSRQYFKKISLDSLRSSSDQYLQDNDKIIQELYSTNKSEALFFSDSCNVYKAKLFEIPNCKAKGRGEYLANIINLEENEKIVFMAVTTTYNGYILFVFENGKASKVSMDLYLTKMNRKKLINAYSDKSPLIFASQIENDCDFVIIRSDGRVSIFNSSLISQSASKNTVGIQVMPLRKNVSIKKVCLAEELQTENKEYFRSDSLPSVGHFLTDKEKILNNI